MTPPHIEEIARAIRRHQVIACGKFPPATVDARVNQSWETCVPEATLAFNMSAEICAKVGKAEARNQISMASAAHYSGGLFEHEINEGADEVEAAIRALITKEE